MTGDADGARGSFRDALRSARRWRDLISPEERRRLLADIARVALAVGQDLYPERGVNDLDIGTARQSDPCPRERLAFLLAAWPRLDAALRALESAPYTALIGRTRLVPSERARRVAPKAVLDALRTGDLVAPLARPLPRRVAETILLPSPDTPENRAVKGALAHFARDLSAISALAQAANVPEVAGDAERLRARLRGHLLRPPWRDLPPPARFPTLSPTLRAHPQYRLVHDTYRRYRQSFRFDWDNPVLVLPARETWLLYEYWGFFQVADVLRAIGWRAAGADGFALLRSGLRFSLARGTASRIAFAGPRGESLTLTYNREFPRAGARDDAGWRSRSHAMRPDITLEIGGRLLLLDPKFKTYAQPGWEAEDIHQMHAYRDALVREGERNVVRAAWLLYAGRVEGGNRSIIAYPASTPGRPFGRGEVGALLLRPGNDGEMLRQALARFLA